MTDYQRWKRTLEQADRLTKLKAPAPVIGHYIVAVLIPRLAALTGVKDFTNQLATYLARGMYKSLGICLICEKERAEPFEELCTGCIKAVDDLANQVEAP